VHGLKFLRVIIASAVSQNETRESPACDSLLVAVQKICVVDRYRNDARRPTFIMLRNFNTAY
jgi:hypothetical protein